MNPAVLTAAAGMRARMESLEVLSNNIANASAPGYKGDQEFYRLFQSAAAKADPRTGDRALMPYVEASRTDFRQGPLETTHAPLDVAISGPGFFAVEGQAGTLYTRNGGFQTDAEGLLRTADGLAVLDEAGARIVVPPDGEIEISGAGEIRVGQRPVGRLGLFEFDSPGSLRKAGHTYFEAPAALEARPAGESSVRQGSLESSNVSVPEAAVRLIGATRHFELLRRAATLVGDEMEGQAVERLARAR